MSYAAQTLPDDPALLKALIAALRAENATISATLRAHDQLIQTLRLRIAKLKKQVFGQSSEKIEREIEQLELALEDLLIASAESETTVPNDDQEEAALEAAKDTADRPSPGLRQHAARAAGAGPRQLLPRLRRRPARGGRGCQRNAGSDRGPVEGRPDRPA